MFWVAFWLVVALNVAVIVIGLIKIYRVDQAELRDPTRCQVTGCAGPRWAKVGKRKTVLEVCLPCRDELVASGWLYLAGPPRPLDLLGGR